MSVLVGSGKGQSSRLHGSTGVGPGDVTKHIHEPPPPLAFSGLPTGVGFDVVYEGNRQLPIAQARSLLRSLSPFTIQVEPPPILSAYMAEQQRGAKVDVGIYGSALQSSTALTNNRAALDSSVYGGSSYRGAPTEEYIAKESAGHRGSQSKVLKPTDRRAGKMGIPSIADLKVAADIALQLSNILNTPPLVLLINPQSVNISYTKLQHFQDRSRYGYIFHAWGEEQPKMSITARCGAFMSGGRGVHVASRQDSAAWQNLMTAVQFYRHNGYIHDTVGKSHAHHFVGGLSIHYDQWSYYGNLESFSLTHEEGNQLGGMTFSMKFTISTMVDSSKANPGVRPMRGPTPSPHDSRYEETSPRPNVDRPGVRSVGPSDVRQFFGGSPATPSTSTGTRNIPGSATTLQTSSGGFTNPVSPSSRTVSTVAAGDRFGG